VGLYVLIVVLCESSFYRATPVVHSRCFPSDKHAVIGWYAGVKVGFGKYRIPEALMVIIVGVALGWITGLNTTDAVDAASANLKWWGPAFTADDLFADFDLAGDYLGVIIPLGISAASGTLMCLVSAKEAGDPFPVRETMVSDGIGTMITSLFGSPFGTVVYIGHPAHKRSGAKVGYSLVNGFIYLYVRWKSTLTEIEGID
jgi:AGZA family xanthine/uracil permease-like MFS transporter